MALPPIHLAAYGGRLAEVNRLLEEDPGLLNARDDGGHTPLVNAALQGHDAVVARLLALGVDVNSRTGAGWTAAHYSCYYNKASTLALLLDGGASINARTETGKTLLMVAALGEATNCLQLLLARGGPALELDAQNDAGGVKALHDAAFRATPEPVQMLLAAGADPTLRNQRGETPLDLARLQQHLAEQQGNEEKKEWAASRVALLEAAMVCDPERPRLLLKARALLDTAAAVPQTGDEAQRKGLSRAAQQKAMLAATPTYLKGRVKEGEELPRVVVVEGEEEKLLGCLKCALGLEGGGGWHEEGEGPPPQGMVWEVFVELCELLVPKWDRRNSW